MKSKPVHLEHFNKIIPHETKQWIEGHADPANFTLHVIGGLWGAWGVWEHDWTKIISGFIVLPVVGTVYSRIGRERFARFFLHHLRVLNLTIHLIAAVILVHGLWTQNVRNIVIAVALSIIGHMYHWWKDR